MGSSFYSKIIRGKKAGIDVTNIILVFLLVLLSGTLIYSISSTFETLKISTKKENNNPMPRMGQMKLTAFDKDLAAELMDKDHDGKCDACGMAIEQCIDGGQLECSMDSNAKMGILGSQHIHADWKVYINGKALDFFDKSHMERMQNNQPVSSFMHVDSGAPAPEKTGDILHMHATGIPLSLFFNSIGMNFDKNCITLDNKEEFCNDANNKLKFLVNGKENTEFENYVFNDLNKILITYGSSSEEEIKAQLASITNFASLH